MTFNKLVSLLTVLLCITLLLLWYVKNDNESKHLAVEEDKIQEVHTEQRDYIDITYLDIGQGDATFIEFPDGTQMLIDCAKDAVILEALGRILPFYDKSIDYLAVTHPDLDHYGGCIDVLKDFDVGHIIFDGFYEKKNGFFEAFLQARADERSDNKDIDALTTWDIASTTITFLYPDHPIIKNWRVPGNTKDTGSNNASLVIKITYGEQDILLMGDAEIDLENYLLSVYPTSTLDVEVLKAGHHGSPGASGQVFIDVVTPEHTIFSAGRGNSYGHPSLRVIRRVERVGSSVWRTDAQGDIRMRVFRDRIEMLRVEE